MARTASLSQLRTDVANQADFISSNTGRYTPTLLTRQINQSIQRFRERVSTEGMTHYLVATTGTITSGATSPYSFKELDLSAASPNIVRVFGVDITVSNIVKTLAHVPFQARNDFGGPNTTGEPQAWAAFQTDSLAILPAPDQSYSYTVWYLPLLADLSADGDTFDGVAGWEQWIVWDVVCNLAARDQYQVAYEQAVRQRDSIWQDVIRGATKVTSAGGAVVGRDTLRASFLGRRRGDCGPIAGGTGLPPDGSVTNAMLASAPEGTTKGRMMGAGAGSPTDLTPGQLARNVAVYSGAAAGLVPTGAGSTTLFLREDGTWAAPSVGGSVSGLALSQIQDLSPNRVLGRIGVATGATQQLTGQQVASMIGVFSGSVHGLVPYPSGGAAGLFLKDDATWATPAGGGGSATGASPSAMFFFAPLSVLGNSSSASGVSEFMNRGQVASLMPLFSTASGSTRGLVYSPTAGVAGRFLRDDGTFQGVPSNVATGVTLAQLAAIPETTVLGRTSPSGIPQALAPSAVATMMPLFNTVDKGLVPAPGVVSGNFLRDDGTWQTTAGGAATGVANSMLLAMAPFTLKGRNNVASGIPGDITIDAVASMLPNHFGGSGTTRGLVYSPTAGTLGRFLRDDGSFQGVPSIIPTGINYTQLLPMPEAVLGRLGASGVPTFLSGSAVGTMLPLFNDVDKGVVPGSGGGTSNFLRADGTWNAPAGGGGSGMIPSPPTGAFQYAGSGFVAASGFKFTASGISNEYHLTMPGSGAIRMSEGSGAAMPQSGFLRFGGQNVDVVVGRSDAAVDAQLLQWGVDGPNVETVGRNTAVAKVWNRAASEHRWLISAVNKASLDAGQLALTAGMQLGAGQLAHSATTDKLGAWTPSGFASVATGISVGASGAQLTVGSGGVQLSASGAKVPSGAVLFGEGGFPAAGAIRLGAVPNAAGGVPVIHGIMEDGTTEAPLVRWNVSEPNGLKFGSFAGGTERIRAIEAAANRFRVVTSDVQRAEVDGSQLALAAGMRVGVPQLSHSATTDKLGSWTPSGFANVATGMLIGASGYQLSVGSGGPQLHASGIAMRQSDMEGVRRINGLDGIKLFGFVSGGGAASGGQNITAPSGTAFIVPETVTTGQIFALVPSLAIHGDTILLENRTAISHMVNNTGTGMGVASGFIATLAPSMGMSARFASGAWEYGNRYQLGGA